MFGSEYSEIIGKSVGKEGCPSAFCPCGERSMELLSFSKESVRKRNGRRYAWKSGKNTVLEVGKSVACDPFSSASFIQTGGRKLDSYILSVCLSLFICEMGITIVPTSWGCVKWK